MIEIKLQLACWRLAWLRSNRDGVGRGQEATPALWVLARTSALTLSVMQAVGAVRAEAGVI